MAARDRFVSAAWALVAAVISMAAALGCSAEQAVTVAELTRLSPEEHRGILLDGMLEGRLLYVKTEQSQGVDGGGGLPGQFVTETWLGTTPDGAFNTAVFRLGWIEDGPNVADNLNLYSRYTLEEWLNQRWETVEWAERAGAEFKGSGKLHQWDSLIYEWKTDSDVQRLEIVENAPLIMRESVYTIDQGGGLTLIQSDTVLEYQLLPAGDAAPPVDY